MEKIKYILKQAYICLFIGLLGGITGALFSHSVSFVTALRGLNGWLIFLLPIGGLISVKAYKLFKVSGIGTNQVLATLKGDAPISAKLLPAVFSGAIITHLLGGSAGREGAALQMGGSTAALISYLFRLNKEETKIATICGMAAFFSALFGTPLGAGIFAVEVVFNKKQSIKWLLPSLLTSFLAFIISQGLLVRPERFSLLLPAFSISLLWKTALVIACACAVCVLWVFTLNTTKELFKKLFKNEYIRIATGGIIIIALTLLVGTSDYNGGGLDIVEKIFNHSQVKYEAFLLKIIFSAITVAAGFKGGEIVPTLFIGATFGAALALVLGFSAPLGAALGMAVLFGGATNCPIATVFLCCEMFGFKGILYFAAAGFTALLLTSKKRLYQA